MPSERSNWYRRFELSKIEAASKISFGLVRPSAGGGSDEPVQKLISATEMSATKRADRLLFLLGECTELIF